ncbi:MAG: PHP domain-containing protein [Desulfurivibrionaceae bacterium]
MSESKTIDLHVHTKFSDGTETPAATVLRAVSRGLAAIAITDHDTVAGVQEGIDQGLNSGLEVISGVELSAVINGKSIHILGYGVKTESLRLLESLEKIQAARKRRNREIMERLRGMDIIVNMEDLQNCSQGGQAGRPHFARILQQKHIVGSTDEAFRLYLGTNGAAYVPREVLTAEEAITIIQKAGGVAVLAHPFTIDIDQNGLTQLIEKLRDCGLAGLEVFYPSHGQEAQAELVRLSKRFNLIITGGSDYHGKAKPNIRMGRVSGNQAIPYRILSDLKQMLR